MEHAHPDEAVLLSVSAVTAGLPVVLEPLLAGHAVPLTTVLVAWWLGLRDPPLTVVVGADEETNLLAGLDVVRLVHRGHVVTTHQHSPSSGWFGKCWYDPGHW